MVVFIILASVLGYLLGARGTYGFLKWRNWARIRPYEPKCSHGYSEWHRGLECHARGLSVEDTEITRFLVTVIWPVWMPFIIVYVVITGQWGKDGDQGNKEIQETDNTTTP